MSTTSGLLPGTPGYLSNLWPGLLMGVVALVVLQIDARTSISTLIFYLSRFMMLFVLMLLRVLLLALLPVLLMMILLPAVLLLLVALFPGVNLLPGLIT